MTTAPPDPSAAGHPAAPGCYRHPNRPTYISCVRCGRPICSDCMRPASVGFQCPEEVAETRRTVRRPTGRFGGQVVTDAYATFVLIGINAVVFLITVASGSGFVSGRPSTLFLRFALIPDRVTVIDPESQTLTTYDGVAHGEYWRLLTSMFLHFGIIHIALNMYVLFAVGPQLEQILGRVRYVGLYLLAGLGGSVASYVFASASETAAGASGAIFGLFGAYFVIARRLRADTGPIVITIAINLVLSFAVANIDVRAHLGGLVTGAVVGVVLAHAPRERRTLVQATGALVVLVLLVVAVGIRTAALRDHPAPGISVAAAAPAGLPAAVPAPAPPPPA